MAQSINSSGDTLKAEACVNVVLPCNVQGAIVLADSATSLPLNTTYTGKTFIVQGHFFVTDSLQLINCHVYCYAGAQIVVTGTGSLLLNNTIIEGCTRMWRGIVLTHRALLWVAEQSIVRDAEIGITALDGASYWIKKSEVVDCVRSIFTPANTSGNNVQAVIDESGFGLKAAAFKQDFSGQAAHDTLPRACIEVYDVVMNLNSLHKENLFYNSNWGIYAVRSALMV
jgi:hypothetical protein